MFSTHAICTNLSSGILSLMKQLQIHFNKDCELTPMTLIHSAVQLIHLSQDQTS